MQSPTRHAFVTGGGRGIGRACAERLAKAGFIVSIGGRSAAHLDETVKAVSAAGGKAHAVELDVASPESVTSAFEKARAAHGPVTVLVNNAGISPAAPFLKVSLDEFQRILNVNLTGAFLCTQVVLPDMLAAKWGRVINIASTAARIGYRYTAAYCASKHGLLGLTRSLALEVARKGVTVNAVCPGWTETEMFHESIERIHKTSGQTREQARAAIEQMNPMGRITQPAEVAEMVAFVASDVASGITGQALGVDGGEAM